MLPVDNKDYYDYPLVLKGNDVPIQDYYSRPLVLGQGIVKDMAAGNALQNKVQSQVYRVHKTPYNAGAPVKGAIRADWPMQKAIDISLHILSMVI